MNKVDRLKHLPRCQVPGVDCNYRLPREPHDKCANSRIMGIAAICGMQNTEETPKVGSDSTS